MPNSDTLTAAGWRSTGLTRKSISDGSFGESTKSSDEVSFGAKYDFGKNHVSAGYLYGEAENRRAIRGEDEASRLMVSYRRDLAKGVQYRLSFIYADFDGEQVGNVDNNEAVGLTTGIRIAF